MEIDLTKLTEEELVTLNHRVVERLRAIRQARCFESMARFDIGDTVSFTPEPGRVEVGTVVRLNHKSVSVSTRDGRHWRVAPGFLSKLIGDGDSPREQGDALLLFPAPPRQKGES